MQATFPSEPGTPLPRPHRHQSVSIIGWLMLLSVVMLLGSIGWVASGQRLFFVQAPLVLLSLALVMGTGLLYFLDPPPWIGPMLLGVVYFTLDLTARQSLVQGGGADFQSVAKGLIGVALFGFGLFNGVWRVFKHPILAIFFAYAAYATFSASYSSAMSLGIGSGMALMGIVFAVAMAATGTHDDIRRLWKSMYIATVVACFISLAILAVFPIAARDLSDPGAYRLRGITGSANSLGPIVAVGFFLSLMWAKWAVKRWHVWTHRFFGFTMLVALLLTNSRSTILGLIGAMVLSYFVAGNLSIIGLLAILLVGTAGMGVMLQPELGKSFMRAFAELFARSGSVQEITSFTGRSQIWEACWQLIQEKPLIGYGFGSVRVEIPKVFFDQWGNTAATAHNFVLESLISVGLVGTLPLIMVFVMVSWGIWHNVVGTQAAKLPPKDADLAMCTFRVLTMFWLHALVERAFAGMASPSTVTLGVCTATCVYLLLKERERTAHHSQLLRRGYTYSSPQPGA